MLSDVEFEWVENQVEDDLERLDHLVLGSSLPWLLPPVIGDAETLNEIGAGSRGVEDDWPRRSGRGPTSSTGRPSSTPSSGSAR
jgi:hypothetical protein